MANKERGETNIILDGKSYVLRPTFEALCEMEDRSGLSVLKMLASMEGGNITMRQMALVIWSGIRGYSPDTELTINDVGNLVMKTGFLGIMEQTDDEGKNPVGEFLLNGVLGGDSGKKSKDAGSSEDPKMTTE